MRLELVRFSSCQEQGTFGRLYLNGVFFGYTVEQPWNDNKPFVSCIPNGVYQLVAYRSDKYGDTFKFVNHDLGVFASKNERNTTNQRYSCMFHWGSFKEDTKGCIAPGEALGAFEDRWMVKSSFKTYKRLCRKFSEDSPTEIAICSEVASGANFFSV